jgi:CubicO group peptidase (beta-lactamase class C family)
VRSLPLRMRVHLWTDHGTSLQTQFQAEKKLPGFGIAVTSVDQELYASAGGFRVHDDPTSGPVTPDSVYWLCSMTKLIVAVRTSPLCSR